VCEPFFSHFTSDCSRTTDTATAPSLCPHMPPVASCPTTRRKPLRTTATTIMMQGKDDHNNKCGVLRSVDRSVRLGRLGVCPECLMAEVGKRLDYNEVRTTERWINTQGESACQALKRMEGRDSAKYSNARGMRCRDSTKYAQRGYMRDVAEALQSIQQRPSDTRSQSYRLLAKLSSLIY
jgi:hypothetical protein